jgi:hypothetical protein
VEIKGVVSQIVKEKQLAVEAHKSGSKELFAMYSKSLEGLQEREKSLRNKEAILLRATPVTKEPRAGTFHLHLLRPFWVIVRVSVSPTRIRLNTSP